MPDDKTTAIQHAQSGHEIINEDVYKHRRDAVQRIAKHVMTEGVHYGLPYESAKTPTLLKAGAEVMCSVFQLAPSFHVEQTNLDNDHREYVVTCNLKNIHTGTELGSGLGMATTKESKYRYRSGKEATEVEMTKKLWDKKDAMKDADFYQYLQKQYEKKKGPLPDGRRMGLTKEGGTWYVAVEGKVENPDIADTYNTILKIAKKRALTDAVLAVTGASEFFTQDLDDFDTPDNGMGITYENAPGKGKIDDTKPLETDEELERMLKQAPKRLASKIQSTVKGSNERRWLNKIISAAQETTKLLTPHVQSGNLDGDYANQLVAAIYEADTQERLDGYLADVNELLSSL